MNDFFVSSATIGVVISLMSYFIGLEIKARLKSALFNPLLISIVIVIAVLLIFDIDYEVYNSSAKYLSYLLTPATVCLAVPLYQKLSILKKNATAIFIGVFAGVIASMVSVLALAVCFGLTHEEYVTLLPKSITTAIGMGVSEELGGYVVITTAVIILTGVFGNIVAESICKIFGIKNSISRGLAIGTAAHAIGTARAMELGEIEGAMSSLAIVISGLCTVLVAVMFANLI